MAIKSIVYLHELLVRFSPDGVQGAHRIDAERVFETTTGEIIAEQMRPAEAVPTDGIAEALGDQMPLVLAENAAVKIDLANANTHATTVEGERDNLRANLQAAQDETASLRSRLEAASDQLLALTEAFRSYRERAAAAGVMLPYS